MTALVRPHPSSALLAGDFAANAADLPGAGYDWLDARRTAAMDAFAASGMPTRRVEAWKYTDFATALEDNLEPATPFRGGEVALPDPFAGIASVRLSFVNGFLRDGALAELPEGVDAVDLSRLGEAVPAWVRDHFGLGATGASQVLGAASFALMRGGIAVRVRVPVSQMLHLQFLNPVRERPVASHTRVLLVLDAGASLTLLESHASEEGEQIFSNVGIEVILGRDAALDHVRLQSDASSALHVTSLDASVAAGARYRALYAALGGRVSRLDAQICLEAPEARAELHGVTVLGRGHADFTTVVDHAGPRTVSRQMFKSVLGQGGRSVAQGRVRVREGAVKSDSHQLFKALLLDAGAEADAKPELEIYADDVMCGHGTAIGALDADALFYLRARGIPEREARGLLVRAFLEDAIEGFTDAALHDALWQRIEAVLPEVAGEAA